MIFDVVQPNATSGVWEKKEVFRDFGEIIFLIVPPILFFGAPGAGPELGPSLVPNGPLQGPLHDDRCIMMIDAS